MSSLNIHPERRTSCAASCSFAAQQQERPAKRVVNPMENADIAKWDGRNGNDHERHRQRVHPAQAWSKP
ncbi:MAG: hypothetical protein J0G95_00405 [Rhizobiales bacterium]|nr:hypothetical protein [Hyphomicrobiales bacterium]